jgi:hypothetical protein
MGATQAGATQGNSAASVDNVAVGYGAMGGNWANQTSNRSVAIGNYAMGNAMNTANDDTAVGHNALNDITLANDCAAFGSGAGSAITEGNNNTCIGVNAGDTITTGGNNTCIGNNADVSATNAEKRIVIGVVGSNASSDETIYIGDNSNYLSYGYGGGGNVTITSDVRIKKNIRDTDLGLDFVNQLRPIKYNMRNPKDWEDGLAGENPDDYGKDCDKPDYDGFVAQEVKSTMDSLGVSFSGWEVEDNDKFENPRQRLAYGQFVVPLVKAVQELSAKVEELESKLK